MYQEAVDQHLYVREPYWINKSYISYRTLRYYLIPMHQ